jgi:branched-chain amino acid transport system permease protein
LPRRRERIDRPIKVLSEDVYALGSVRRMLYVAAPRALPALLLLAVAALAPGLYLQRVIAIAAVYGLLALSWDFLAGTTGFVSLGQALFFGAGAYTTAMLDRELGLPPLLAVPSAAVVGGIACTALLLPSLPLRGIYFSMTTLVYPLLFARLIEATGALGGTDGWLGIAPLPGAAFERLTGVVVLLAATFSLRRFLVTDRGTVLRATGDDDLAARASGLAVTRYRIVAIFVAASLGALSGAYFTHLYMAVGMSAFALDLSILPIAAAVLGGVGTLGGPVLGAFILVPLSEVTRDLGSLRIVAYSGLLVIMVLWKPEGLLAALRRRYEQTERWVEA